MYRQISELIFCKRQLERARKHVVYYLKEDDGFLAKRARTMVADGPQKPILIDKNNKVIDGYFRCACAMHRGDSEIKVEVTECND